MAAPTLYLFDGSSLAYRAFYALQARGGQQSLTTRTGLPTGAIHGFINTLRRLLRDGSPSHVAIAFDERGPTFRHEAYPEYKGTRKPTPEDLVSQLPSIRRAATALGLPVFATQGVEADDLIGTLARVGTRAGLEVVIVTSDKDMYQLLDAHTSMLQIRNDTRMVRADDVPEVFGVTAAQVVDVLALWGDSSDNIPGVPGIGEKGAKELVRKWGGVEEIYANLDELKPGQAKRLREGRHMADLSLDLATIRTGLEIDARIDDLAYAPGDDDALFDLATEFELTGILKSLHRTPAVVNVTVVGSVSTTDLDALISEAEVSPLVAITPHRPFRADHRGPPEIALCHKEGHAWNVTGADLASTATRRGLTALLANETLRKTTGDLKALLSELVALKLPQPSNIDDVGILAYLLNPGSTRVDVRSLAETDLGRRLPEPDTAPSQDGLLPFDDPPVTGEATGHIAEATHQLTSRLADEVDRLGLRTLYDAVEIPLVRVLAAMENTGVVVDENALSILGIEMEEKIASVDARIYQLAGGEFNIDSPRQLATVLFEKLGLESVKKTRKTGVSSTDSEVLRELAEHHEVPLLVEEHRELVKLKRGYVDVLPGLVRKSTGRVHCTFHQTVTATGRLSCSHPNLQNIPVRSELGKRIRRAFIAPPGSVLIVADYSQIELRLLAHLSGDSELLCAFHDEVDVHTRTAAAVFDVAEPLVTEELRRRAKVINFGIIYGMSDFGLGRELGLPTRDAKAIIEDYFARYAGVREWLDRTIAEARETGQVRTLLGRVRPLPAIRSSSKQAREMAERTATNTPIQGTAADLVKLAMLRVHARLESSPSLARLTIQVHDELVVEAPEADAEALTAVIRDEMESVMDLKVPLRVNAGVGKNWLEAK